MYNMNCGISSLVILHILHIIVVCYCSARIRNSSILMVSAVKQNHVRFTRNEPSCLCKDARNKKCGGKVCTECTKSACPSETDFCKYMRNFGTPQEKLWGSLTCLCENGKGCQSDSPFDTTDPSLTVPRVLVDTQPEVGELQHTYICPYRWDRTKNPSVSMYYSTGFGLSFHATLDLFHVTRLQMAVGTYMADTFNASKENAVYYCFWIHQPYYLRDQQNLETFTLSINMTGMVNYYRSFQIIPKRTQGRCHPTTLVSNCNNTAYILWSRDRTYTLRSELTRMCKNSTLSSTLRITRLGTSRETPPFPVFFHLDTLINWIWDYGGGNWYMNITNSTEYMLKGRDLHFGLNAAVLEVVETPPPGSGNSTGKNVVMCFINVTSGATIALIRGGPELKFQPADIVKLDGGGSINPNVEISKVKQTLGYSWSCWDKDDPNDITVCKGRGVELSEDAVYNPSFSLVKDRLYVFQLMTFDKTMKDLDGKRRSESRANVTVEVFAFKTARLEMTFCVNLCGCSAHKAQAEEMVYFQASCTAECPDHIEYKWEVLPDVPLPESAFFEPSDKLMIKSNVLKEGEKYTITVRGGNNGKVDRTIIINKKPLPGKCDIKPQSGNVEDSFTLACTGFQDEDIDKSLTYKVYQEDAEWKRLLVVRVVSHPWTVELRGLQLMEGRPVNLTIEVVDFYGSVARTTVLLQVNPPSVGWTIGTIKRMFAAKKNVTNKVERIQTIFVLTDALGKPEVDYGDEKTRITGYNIRKTFLEWIDNIPLALGTDVLQVSSALHALVTKRSLTHHENKRLASAIVLKMAKKVHEVAENGPIYGCLSNEEIHIIITSLVVTSVSNLVGINLVESDKTPKIGDKDNPYPDYTGFNTDDIEKENNNKFASNYAIEALDILGSVFSRNQADYSDRNEIVADTVIMWTKTGRPCKLAEKYLPDSSNVTEPCTNTTVHISNALCQYLAQTAPLLTVKLSVFQNNPQGFKPGSEKLNAEFVSIAMFPFAMKTTPDNKPIENIPYPIDIYLMVKHNQSTDDSNGTDHGNISVDPTINMDDMEDSIAVHRVVLEKGSKMIVMFDKNTISKQFDAVVTQDIRPNMNDFKKSKTIKQVEDAESNKYDMEYDGYAKEDGTWFYLGVLPTKSEIDIQLRWAIGKNLEFSYAFKIFQVKCSYMIENGSDWLTEGCVIGPETQLSCLHCQCKHLSVFTGSMIFLPSKEDPFVGVEILPKRINTNIFVACVVIFVWLMFLIGLLLARRKDRGDTKSISVRVLEDNKPDDTYSYLIVVYTGYRQLAGTSSEIGFELVGEDGHTGPRIFSSSNKPVLQRGTERTFLLTVGTELGELKNLHLWSNNSGRSPKWYCDKVVVIDVRNQHSWVFHIESWLSVWKGGGEVEKYAVPATKEVMYSKKYVLKTSLFNGFRENHIWSSIWLKHPLSNFTRCERLSIAVLGVIIMMVCVVMYDLPENNLEVYLRGQTRLWGIALFAALVAEIPVELFVFLFKRCQPADPTSSLNNLNSRLNNRTFPDLKQSKFTFYCKWISFNFVWILCIITALAISCFVSYSGLSYSTTKGYLWLLTVIFAVLLFVVLVEPVKIFIQAGYLVKRREKGKHLINKYINFISSIMLLTQQEANHVRIRELYRPLQKYDIKHKKKVETTKNNVELMLVDLLVFLFFFVTLFFMVLSNRDDLSYQSMRNLVDAVAESSMYDALSSINTTIEIIDFLNLTLIPSLFVSSHYNGDNVSEIALTADYSTHLLGIPRLRQLRVKNNTCVLHSSVRENNITDKCDGEYNEYSEDSKDYNLRWTEDLDNYELADEKAKAVWKYSLDNVTGSMPILGELRLYPSGGYVANLGRTLVNSRTILNFLVENDWFDARTRVVFIEFTTYNANRNLFNVVTLVIERSASTAIVTSTNVATVQLLTLSEDVNVALNVVFFIAMTAILLHYLRNVFQLKENHWKEMVAFWNVVDLFILMLCMACVTIFLLRHAYVQDLLEQLLKSESNEYISFSLAAYFDMYFSYALAILVCLSTCRLWRLLHFSKVVRQMEWTLANSVVPLSSLFILMVVLVIMFSMFGSLVFGHFSKEFRNPYKSVVTLFIFANRMFPKLNMDRIIFVFSYMSIIYFVMFYLAYTFYFFNMFFAVLTGRYGMLRLERATRGQYEYGPFDYLREEISYHRKSFRNKYNYMKTLGKRLRGGRETDLNLVAVPKSPNTRNYTTVALREARSKAMALLTLEIVKSKDEVRPVEDAVDIRATVTPDTTVMRSNAMLALVLDDMNCLVGKGEVYVLGKSMSPLMVDERLILMETTLNTFTRTAVGCIDSCEDEFDYVVENE